MKHDPGAVAEARREDGLDADKLRMVDVSGIGTRVYEDGEGQPLVLIHGGDFGPYVCSLDSWSLNLRSFAESFRVIAFDKLGEGCTAPPARSEDYSFDALERHAVELLNAVRRGQAVHLVGHSMGGFLATRIALKHPEIVSSLVIVDSATTAADDPRFSRAAFYADLEQRVGSGPLTRESLRIRPEAQSWSRDHISDDFLDRLLEIARDRRTPPADVYERWFTSLQPLRAQTLVEIADRGIPVPTLIVWGRDDPSARYEVAIPLFEAIASRTEDVGLEILARAGHYVFRERPAAFEALVTSFCLRSAP